VQSSTAIETADREGLGILLTMTSNEEVNALACLRYAGEFGRARTFQLPPHNTADKRKQAMGEHQHGRLLFDVRASYKWLDAHFQAGAEVVTVLLEEQISFEQYEESDLRKLLPLFTVSPGGDLSIVTANEPPLMRGPLTVIALALPETASSDKVL